MERLVGYFGSLYKNILVFRVKDAEFWYVLQVDDEKLQWDMYCTDAELIPAVNGMPATLFWEDNEYTFPCWEVYAIKDCSMAMAIADSLAGSV